MRHMKSAFTYVVLLTLLSAIVSCSKDGPAGATGPAGAAGSTGPAGPAGPKGDTGVANIIYSDWLTVTFAPNSDSSQWSAVIAAPKLSNVILTTGDVKVYVNANSATAPVILPLPYFDGFSILNDAFELQKIDLISTDDFSTYTDTGVKFQQYRYILVPGGVHARSAIDWNNYAEVKKYLGLKD
jgi:hypothetical protein